MSKITEFPANIVQELNYYVYIYSDRDTLEPFYIGKGKGNRCFNHLFQEGGSDKIKKIQELKEQGKTPKSLLKDAAHYNDECRTVIAKMLYKKIKELNMI